MTTSETPQGWPGDTREPWPGDPDEQGPPDVPVTPELDDVRDEDDPMRKSDNTSDAAVEPPD
jgi:hypothetical protein